MNGSLNCIRIYVRICHGAQSYSHRCMASLQLTGVSIPAHVRMYGCWWWHIVLSIYYIYLYIILYLYKYIYVNIGMPLLQFTLSN